VDSSCRYALVGYIKDPVGEFVEKLRCELHPELPLMPAHVTVLPPRPLRGSESEAIETLEEICSQVEPFEVSLGEIETFIPVTPTVFIRVAHAAHRLRELHDRLDIKSLATEEQWPYMPHVTIIKVPTEEQAQKAYLVARKRWAQFGECRTIQIKNLTFVREREQNSWVDLARVRLGPSLVTADHR
jgi:2'-5' RNA ligase